MNTLYSAQSGRARALAPQGRPPRLDRSKVNHAWFLFAILSPSFLLLSISLSPPTFFLWLSINTSFSFWPAASCLLSLLCRAHSDWSVSCGGGISFCTLSSLCSNCKTFGFCEIVVPCNERHEHCATGCHKVLYEIQMTCTISRTFVHNVHIFSVARLPCSCLCICLARMLACLSICTFDRPSSDPKTFPGICTLPVFTGPYHLSNLLMYTCCRSQEDFQLFT